MKIEKTGVSQEPTDADGRIPQKANQNQMDSSMVITLFNKMVQEVRDYAILLLDTEGTVLNWNPGAETIKGYTAEDIIGNNFRLFYTSEDRDKLVPETFLLKAIREGRASHEGWRLKKDGSKFWGLVTLTALHDDNRTIVGFSKLTRDLSDHKELENRQERHVMNLAFKNEELRKSEERYHRMISEVEDYAIILLDIDGNILNWNKGAESIKGYTPEEILGKNFKIFYLQNDIDSGLPDLLIRQAREKGKASHEGWRVKKDGNTFWGSIVITALHDDHNNIVGFSKVTRDLTERKTAEERLKQYAAELQLQNEKLKKSEDRYHRMIAEVEDYAIILLDQAGNILNWNKGAKKIKGYDQAEIIGKNFRTFYLEQDRNNQLPEQLLAEAVKNNKATHEGWRLRKDGSQFWGSIVITALHNEEGNVTGFSKVTRDLTEKKNYEEFILQQNKQLQEYAYIASHDLQEPLRKIIMFSGALEKNLDNKETAMVYMDKISVATNRMSSLIQAVLEYSKMDVNVDSNTVVDLNVLLGEIESDFDLLLKERNGNIVYSNLPLTKGIPVQLNQLFSNLISNAIKFNDKNPEISIVAIPQKTSDNEGPSMIQIRVTDNGIGFKPEYSEKIFKMFHRLQTNKSGTGIGLALCKKIAMNHGGDITASSIPGEGTIIDVFLPTGL